MYVHILSYHYVAIYQPLNLFLSICFFSHSTNFDIFVNYSSHSLPSSFSFLHGFKQSSPVAEV